MARRSKGTQLLKQIIPHQVRNGRKVIRHQALMGTQILPCQVFPQIRTVQTPQDIRLCLAQEVNRMVVLLRMPGILQ